jgi:hypothetical protein
VSLVDKVPVLDNGDQLTRGTAVPSGVEILCDVLEWTVDQAGNRSAIVRLRSNVEDQSGRTTFNVDEDALATSPELTAEDFALRNEGLLAARSAA